MLTRVCCFPQPLEVPALLGVDSPWRELGPPIGKSTNGAAPPGIVTAWHAAAVAPQPGSPAYEAAHDDTEQVTFIIEESVVCAQSALLCCTAAIALLCSSCPSPALPMRILTIRCVLS